MSINRSGILMAADLAGVEWRKSSRSLPGNKMCVEVARMDDGVAVRDSKNPQGAALRFNEAEWGAFVAGVRDGEFDLS